MIDIQQLAVSLGARHRPVLRGLSLSVARGSFVALVGRSGSGKTTLLKSINRLVTPQSGRIAIDGIESNALPAPAWRRQIGYAFQGVGLFPHMSVAENIGIVPKLLGWEAARIDARVRELTSLVDLPDDIVARAPRDLSGGQQQRVGLARALAAAPHVMLLDEPFGALDPITRDALGVAYRRLHERLGLTTLMVTHDLEEALLLCDRIVLLEEGGIVADHAPRDLARSTDPRVISLLAPALRHARALSELVGDSANSQSS